MWLVLAGGVRKRNDKSLVVIRSVADVPGLPAPAGAVVPACESREARLVTLVLQPGGHGRRRHRLDALAGAQIRSR
jgi:hypothetical protein